METKNIILKLRTERGMSQDELADKIMVTRQAVSRWEHGDTIPNTDTLKLLSKEFDVSINTLLGEPRKLICQCCGMPIDDDSILGRDKDGTLNEEYCKWCYADGTYTYTCFDREGHECFQKDDMTKVYEKLKMADVLVIASPVYFYGVSAQLKALIDRLHTPMRNEFNLKKLALILVGAAALPELFDAIKVQYRLVLNYFKLEDAGTVFVRGAKDKGDVKKTDGLERAYQLGTKII